MKRIAIALLIILIISVVGATLVSCGRPSQEEYISKAEGYLLQAVTDNGKTLGADFSGWYFGTSNIGVNITVYSSNAFNLNFNIRSTNLTSAQLVNRNLVVSIFNDVHRFITLIDSVADTQTDTSDVYRYNHALYGDKLYVNEHTYNMMLVAKEMYAATNGAFNPAVYRLVDLWGFSSRMYTNLAYGEPYDRYWDVGEASVYLPLPDDKYITAFSNPSFTDFGDSAVTLGQDATGYYVIKNVAPAVVDGDEFQQWIDLGGIAKGYIADYIDSKLRQANIDRFSVDVGSSSLSLGSNYDGETAAIGIASPFTMQSVIFVDVADNTMSTSGQYLRKYTVDGQEYAHIIDGSTGCPAQTGIKLVSVVAPNGSGWAGKGDCLTTALTVMGKDGIIDFMNGYLKDNGIAVYAIYQNGDKQEILSNVPFDSLAYTSSEIAQYSWNVTTSADGQFVYNADAALLPFTPTVPVVGGNYKWLIIVLSVFVGLCVVAVTVFYFIKGRKSVASNVINAKRDKPFKLADVGVYFVVLLLILILFGTVFLGGDSGDDITVVRVVDMETQQVLFVCDVSAKRYNSYNDVNGWQVQVVPDGNSLQVTLTKTFDGEERFNTLLISLADGVAGVKMVDSACGVHQQCVRNFSEVFRPNSTIICSPNRLKVITE